MTVLSFPLRHNAYNHEKISYLRFRVDRFRLLQIVLSVNYKPQREKYWIPIIEVIFIDSYHYVSAPRFSQDDRLSHVK